MGVVARICWMLGAALPLLGATGGSAQPAKEVAPPPARISRVIELFTSQGCPRCPAADSLIGDLAREPDTLALSFAVSTWDYAGWKDTLATPTSTQRQRAYAAGRGDGLVYTPQAVVDGLRAQPGADGAAIRRTCDALRSGGGTLGVPISLSEKDGRLAIAIAGGKDGGALPAASRAEPLGVAVGIPVGIPVGIYVLRVERAATVVVGRGENSGRSLTYTNVVRAMQRIGDWTGEPARFDLVVLKGENEGFVVLLQAGTPGKLGAILAAAKTPDL